MNMIHLRRLGFAASIAALSTMTACSPFSGALGDRAAQSTRATTDAQRSAYGSGIAGTQSGSTMGPGAVGSGSNASSTTMGTSPVAPTPQGTTAGAVVFDERNTPGWSQMSAAERDTHRSRMASMRTYGECQAYLNQHAEQMKGRLNNNPANTAAAPGQGATPTNDPCGHLRRS